MPASLCYTGISIITNTMAHIKPSNSTTHLFDQQCRYCDEWKPYTVEYFRPSFGVIHPGRICIKCANTHANSRKYGLTYKQRKQHIEATTHCPICNIKLQKGVQGVKGAKLRDIAVIDHDHTTNKFRGILCNNCNRGLGLLGDSVENLENAIAYLQSSEERVTLFQ